MLVSSSSVRRQAARRFCTEPVRKKIVMPRVERAPPPPPPEPSKGTGWFGYVAVVGIGYGIGSTQGLFAPPEVLLDSLKEMLGMGSKEKFVRSAAEDYVLGAAEAAMIKEKVLR
jgi:hypothetical protein